MPTVAASRPFGPLPADIPATGSDPWDTMPGPLGCPTPPSSAADVSTFPLALSLGPSTEASLEGRAMSGRPTTSRETSLLPASCIVTEMDPSECARCASPPGAAASTQQNGGRCGL